jgi:hypothetical protein
MDFGKLFNDFNVSAEGQLTSTRSDFLRLDFWEFVGQIQTVKVVRLNEVVDRVDKSNSVGRRLQKFQPLIRFALNISTDTQKDFKSWELSLQLSGESEKSLKDTNFETNQALLAKLSNLFLGPSLAESSN